MFLDSAVILHLLEKLKLHLSWIYWVTNDESNDGNSDGHIFKLNNCNWKVGITKFLQF